ncbi:MAG: hypothetical protein JWR03_2465 [Cohnella sp.]|jgi:hypothetical protein|nr:hypothetical protein [Cohnella sp.]
MQHDNFYNSVMDSKKALSTLESAALFNSR